jgi:hypothetical protein
MSSVPFSMGYTDTTWSYFEAGHGKGAPDGVGAAIKRLADSLVSSGKDILSAKNLYDELSVKTDMKLFLIDDDSISRIDKLLPHKARPLPGLMMTHQLQCTEPGIIKCFGLSCGCNRTNTVCICRPTTTTLWKTNPEATAAITPKSVRKTEKCSKQQPKKKVNHNSGRLDHTR